MADRSLLRAIDAVTVQVPDLDVGLSFYRDRLGHELIWRNDETRQAGLRLPEGEAELVLAVGIDPAANWLVGSVEEAVARVVAAGGTVISAAVSIPVGRVAMVADPFGNSLVLVDLTAGRYVTDGEGRVVGVEL